MSLRFKFVQLFAEFPLEPFRMRDLSSLVKLEKQAFPIDYWTKMNFLEELATDPESIQVIRDKDQVIGYVHSEVRKVRGKNGKVEFIGEIGSIAVDKHYRGKKLGEKLFNFGLKRLQTMNASRIIINTRLDNQAMKTLAETKFGFSVNRIVRNMYEDGAGAYEMILN